MKTNVLITKYNLPNEPYPWEYIVQGPLGGDAPGIDWGTMETRDQAEEMAALIVKDANTLSLGELMDKYGTHWTAPDEYADD